MTIRAVLIAILAVALGLGGLMWWLQTRALYKDVLTADAATLQLFDPATGGATPVAVTGLRALDSDSSPIRYRACFALADPAQLDALAPYPGATPLNAPGWFGCFDAGEVTRALEDGTARAFLAEPDVGGRYGVDRVLAALPDGRGVLWQQMNACGEALYGGGARPEGCGPPPDGLRFDERPTD